MARDPKVVRWPWSARPYFVKERRPRKILPHSWCIVNVSLPSELSRAFWQSAALQWGISLHVSQGLKRMESQDTLSLASIQDSTSLWSHATNRAPSFLGDGNIPRLANR